MFSLAKTDSQLLNKGISEENYSLLLLVYNYVI